MKLATCSLAAALLTAVALPTAEAGHSPVACTVGGNPTVVPYYTAAGLFPWDPNDFRCDTFDPDCRLYGWLMTPASTSPSLPAVILEHGSGTEQDLDFYCVAINYWLSQNYVVYMPFRRGVHDNTLPSKHSGTGFYNSGWTLEDWADHQAATSGNDDETFWEIEYMKQEAYDVQNVLTTLKAQVRGSTPLVDPNRIALVGHSFGGAFVTIASGYTYSPQPRVVAALSGAAMSYNESPDWPAALKPAARSHREPIFFDRVRNESPENDFASAQEPYNEAIATGPAEIQKFASITPSTNVQTWCDGGGVPQYKCVHFSFVIEQKYVIGYMALDGYKAGWMPKLMDFFVRRGM